MFSEFTVSWSGSCSGYRWTINWVKTYGDQPLLNLTNIHLVGAPADVTATALRDGGLWIRPIRGDMLRLPELEPQVSIYFLSIRIYWNTFVYSYQVEVIINQVPSSCRSKNCSFSYNSDSTPEVAEISPKEGQVREIVEIYGTGFSDDMESIKVAIGLAQCQVVFANESLIRCTAGPQSAGCYSVTVSVDGMGMALSTDLISFTYLVTVNSIVPPTGGSSGGNLVMITGNSFPKLVRKSHELHNPLPWFRYGIGEPEFDMVKGNDCPSFGKAIIDQAIEFDETSEPNETIMTAPEADLTISSFNEFIKESFSMNPLQVVIGETPCVIVEANVTTITCVPLSSSEGTFGVTIIVFNQTSTLKNAYTVTHGDAITVENVYPSSGPVVGNSRITITGSSFSTGSSSNDIQVMIDRSPCHIQYYNKTHIVCDTPRMVPGVYPVFISTSNGFAIKSKFAADLNMPNVTVSSLFPTFTYQLEISNVSLSIGSIFGGTEITMYGGIFVSEATSVTIGGAAATIVSVSDSVLTFLTPSSSRTHSAILSAQLVRTG